MPRQCLVSAYVSFLSLNFKIILYDPQISKRYIVPDTGSVIKHNTNKLIDTQLHPQMISNSYPKQFCSLAPLHSVYQPSVLTSNTRRASTPFFPCTGSKKRKAISMSPNHIHNTLGLLHISIKHTQISCTVTSFIYSQTLALFCKIYFTSRQHHASKTAIFHRDAHLRKFNRENS